LTGKTIHISIIVFILFPGIFQQPVVSQDLGDTLRLPEVEIKSSYTLKNQGFKKVRMDSSLLVPRLNADLSTILSQYSTIFIKSYGNGSLATPSFRGTSANHTQVEWNGISINSPMLGQSDLSQVPVSQFDGIEILYGAAGIPKTSGAFGGIINLVTNPDWNSRINVLVGQTVASFNTYNTDANISFGNKTVQSDTKLNYSTSLNDFLYYNDQTGTREHQINAYYDIFGITEEVFLRISDKNYLSARAWYSQDVKNLPPITTNINPEHVEVQKDRSLRSLVEWKLLDRDYSFTVRSAIVDQFMNYKNDSIDANHQYYSWINRARFVYSGIQNLSLRPGIDYNYDWVISDSYDGTKTRGTAGIFAEIGYELWKKVDMSLVLRQDIIDQDILPFIPAFGVDYKPFNKINITFSANVSRNYRYPSLNDLYWSVSGNPDLSPETDYAAEAGVTYNYLTKNKAFFIESELTGYYSNMLNLIMWTPVSGSGLWRPMNVDQVLARGAEVGLNLAWNYKRLGVTFNNNYNYCKSTYEKAKSEFDASVGKQVIYIPVNTMNSTLGIKFMGFFGSYNFSFTGKRYTGTDNLTYMPAYNLSNIILGKNFSFTNIVLSLQLEINNLFDLDYQSIANRPMPGRNYALTVRFNFKK
jgi:outer membrane cobalamin receptor